MRKSLILVLILTLLFQSGIALALTYDGGNTLVKESDWGKYKTAEFLDSSLPYFITDSKGNKHYFNRELWEELSLVVYGDYRSIYPNNFKTSTLNPSGEAYYKTGEYRYHGYNRTGGYVNNIYFHDDAVGSNNLEMRTWVYEPWKDTSPAYTNFRNYVGEIGIYNDVALNYNNEHSTLVAEWINESVDFIEQGTINGIDKTQIMDPVYYNNIDSAPSAYSSGQGTLFHKASNNNKIYYQTFPVEKYDKKYTEIEADIPEVTTTNVKDNGDITISIQVTGEILDELYMGDSIKESIYYTRRDIVEWNFTLTNNITSDRLTAKGINKNSNKEGYYNFSLTIPRSKYFDYLDSKDSFNIIFTAKAETLYSTKEKASDTIVQTKNITGVADKHVAIEFDVNAPTKILDVDLFAITVTEKDVADAIDRYVLIDGIKLTEANEQKFLNGQYKFPQIREDKVYSYSINYLDPNDEIAYFSSSVVVYDSVPHAQVRVGGIFKENRKITATADTSIVSDYLNSRSTVTISEFRITSLDGTNIYYGTNNNQYKEFLKKSEGNINVLVTVSNEYGSRSYNHQIYVSPDYEPDIIAMVWNNVLIRNEGLDVYSEGASLDGDTVTTMSYKIYYDTDNDEIPDAEVYSGIWEGSTDYLPDKLGNYKIVFKVTEAFGEETIPAYITDADKRTKTIEREFFVDNLIPMTKIYTDIEYTFPSLDVAFLLDEGLSQTETDYLRSSRIDITNNFRANSMTADIDVWDLKTYVNEQTAYATLHTGTTYPSSSTPYNDSGYGGTLMLYDLNNFQYMVDYGGYQTFYDSFTAYSTGSGYSITRYFKGAYYSSESSNTPSIAYYNSGGYAGTLYKTSSWISGKNDVTNGLWRTVTIYYTASYSGTVTRSWQEYVPNYIWFNDYYGYYSGTVYKNVKQTYNPSYKTDSSKYIIYYANDEISNISDYNYLKNIAKDSKVIFVGDPSLESTFTSDYFIPYSSDTTSILNEIVSIIKEENPVYQGVTVLINEPFEVSYSDLDHEGDPIIIDGVQYVHNPYFFDNSLGQENGTLTAYSESGYTSLNKTFFSKPGLYIIYRSVKDEPVGYENLGGNSNIAALEIVAHRKPIANVKMDYDFIASTGTYIIDWIDLSYDPDFQNSSANRGIIDRSIKYKSSTGNWIYGIPNNLAPGSYTLEYVVMDCYNVWSDILTINLTLKNVPDIQLLDAKLATEDPEHSILSVMKGENLKLYDVLSRYPYSHNLNVAIYQGTTRLSSIQTIVFTPGNIKSQNGNDVSWNDIIIPTNLTKGNYYIKVTAVGIHGDTASIDLPFSVIDINITGFVNHTEQWDANRLKYNRAISGTDNSPNTYDVFFAGERFILNADTLGETDDVLVEILGTSYSTYLIDEGNDKWDGFLWYDDMLKWGNKNLTFRFTAIKDDIPIKYYDVPIRVIDDEYWRQHRLF